MRSAWWAGDWPVTQPFGPTKYPAEPPGYGFPHFHMGIDIGMPEPTHLFSRYNGFVVEKGLSGYGAQSIRFRTSAGDVILGHLDSSAPVGSKIFAGSTLGFSGGADNDDGNSSGAHLHFEVRPLGGGYGTAVDPAKWLTISATLGGNMLSYKPGGTQVDTAYRAPDGSVHHVYEPSGDLLSGGAVDENLGGNVIAVLGCQWSPDGSRLDILYVASGGALGLFRWTSAHGFLPQGFENGPCEPTPPSGGSAPLDLTKLRIVEGA